MLNICSSVHDHNQSTIQRKILVEQVKSKGIYLKLKSIWKNASDECIWRTASEEELLKTRHQKQGYHKQWSLEAYLIRSSLIRVDKGQCTKCTTTNSALVSATTFSVTCLQMKTRITTIFQQTLFLWKRNGFEISSS